MKIMKNIGIVFGFWIIGMLVAMGSVIVLDLDSPLADDVVRDVSIGIMFFLIALYYKRPYYYLVTIVMLIFAYMEISNTNIVLKEEKPKIKQIHIEKKEPSAIQKVIERTADAVNKKTPINIDSDIRLDTAQAFVNNLTYFYSIKTFSKNELNNEFYTTLKTNVQFKSCTTPELEVFFENNVSVSYVYNDKNGLQVLDVKVTPAICKDILQGIQKIKALYK